MSTRYNTRNPIESADVRDMSDNAKNLDLFSNSSDMAFDDRFGVERKTIHGMNSEFNSHILNMGFARIGTFASGATLTNPRQTLLWDIADGGDGQEYGWSGAFPKVVPASSTPASTGGISVGAWISRFDPELRIQVREALRRSYAEAGYNLVAGSFEVGGTLVNANDVLLHESSGKAYSGPAGTVPAGTNPASGGFVDKSGELLRHELATSNGATKVRTSDGRTVEQRLAALPNEVDAAGTAAALISQHNSSSTAHPELSAFISAEADRAEVARDAAFVNADVYPDIATGRAAVANGKQFQVVAGDEVVRYRRDSESTQTEVARYPSTKYVADGKVGVFDRISPNLYDLYRYSDLTALERRAFKVIRRLDITGSDELFRISLVVSGGQITTFTLINSDSTFYMNMLEDAVGSVSVFDRVYHFEASLSLPNGSIFKVSALLDIRDSPDFTYDSSRPSSYLINRSTGDKQFPNRYVGRFPAAIQNSFVSVGFDELRVKLTPDTMFMRFYVSEPTVLGSVVLFAENVPSVQPAYVECAIYEPESCAYPLRIRFCSRGIMPLGLKLMHLTASPLYRESTRTGRMMARGK